MRILKYVLLLILLFSVAFFVFVSTQKSTYKVIRSKEISIAPEKIFEFLNDSKLQPFWSPWDKKEAYIVNKKMQKNKNIAQDILIYSNKNNSFINLKKTAKGTLVQWELSGNLDFDMKLNCVLRGGIENVIGNKLDLGLNKIDDYLVIELSSYFFSYFPNTTFAATSTIKQKDSCAVGDFYKNVSKTKQSLVAFAASNKLTVSGKPYISYFKKQNTSNSIVFYVSLPIKEEILTTEGSLITGSFQEEIPTLKLVMKGDFAHKNKAFEEINAYLEEEKLEENTAQPRIELPLVFPPNELKPSKWVTEFYIPIKVKKKRVATQRTQKDSEEPEAAPLIVPVQIPKPIEINQ